MITVCVQGGLLVRLMKAADLPPADNNGKSDPYVIFKIDGREQRSTVKPQCLEATWDEKFEWMKVLGCLCRLHLHAQSCIEGHLLLLWRSQPPASAGMAGRLP